jgi:hypothetical protein
VRATIDLPDELLREAKAFAAREGLSLAEVLTTALRNHLRGGEKFPRGQEPWRRSFGTVDPKDLEEVDRIIEEEFGRIDLDTWR